MASLKARKADAEQRLQALHLLILTDGDIAAWNEEKNENGGFDRDVILSGWQDEDGQLTKEFYVRDPTGEEVGLYRKAWYYDDGAEPELILTDYDHKELDPLLEATTDDDDPSFGM